MPSWSTPKTDWNPTDYFNLTDWNRIRNNLLIINELLAQQHMITASLVDITFANGTLSIPYVHNVNDLESNLLAIYECLRVPLHKEYTRTFWYGRLNALYRGNPTSADWNRWEQLLLTSKECLDYMSVYKYQRIMGTFYAGTNNLIQKFSRGR